MVASLVPVPSAAHAVLVGVLLLAAAIWVGGFVALVVVARVARRALEPTARVVFFRMLGRRYGVVGSLALLVGLATGAVLLTGRPWNGLLVAIVTVAGLLVVGTVVGVVQARRMTRLRRDALRDPDDAALAGRVRRVARRAALLRASIGGSSLALIALAAPLVG